MKKLHPKQTRILELLRENIDNPLSIKVLMERIDEDSPGVLYHHLKQLETKGYLKRNPNNSKDYVVLDKPENAVVYIPKYGMAQCGLDGRILSNDPIEQIPIASNLIRFSAKEAFIVEAKGDSMEPKINQGDLIIAKKQTTAEHGDIIVCVYDLNAIIKKYSNISGNVTLVSLNQNNNHYPLVVREENEFKIEGVVKNILNYN